MVNPYEASLNNRWRSDSQTSSSVASEANFIRFLIEVGMSYLWPLSLGCDHSTNVRSFTPGENDYDTSFYDEHYGIFDAAHRRLQDEKNASKYEGSTSLVSGSSDKADSKGIVDYSILSVTIMTLALLLVVEFLLHQLDHLAHHRKFFKSVIRTFYKELAILGIVEWAVYLLQTYYQGMNKAKKSLFEKVHFALFYTAILNVVTSALIYIGCRLETNRLWVETEELELDHYIELREEFDRVQMKIARIEEKDAEDLQIRLPHSPEHHDETAEEPLTFNGAWRNLKQRIRHPLLVNRYNKLIVQVRFHELRMHFIKANGLPVKFMVSEYLKKCQQSVLSHCVHLSSLTWIILMAISNLTYFLMSMVVVGTGDKAGTEVMLTVLFYVACVGMLFLSILILRKVKWIFSQIMHKKLIDCTRIGKDNDNDAVSTSVLKLGSKPSIFRQIDLFWFRDPHAIIKTIQFMQFGFAIALSTCIIFWSDINKATKYDINTSLLMTLVCLVCAILFLFLTTRIVPRYTLCTNIGQLVNKKALLPMMASYSLDECVKRRQRENHVNKQQKKLKIFANPSNRLSNTNNRLAKHDTCRYAQLADFVKMPTDSLPKLDPDERKARRKRTKATSDGVATMRSISQRIYETNTNESQEVPKVVRDDVRIPRSSNNESARKARRRVVSEGVSMMRADFEADNTKAKNLGLQLNMDSLMEDIPAMSKDPSTGNVGLGRAQLEYEDDAMIDSLKITETDPENAGNYENESDTGDLPEVANKAIQHQSSMFCNDNLQDFFMSAKYRYLSGLLGTMACFFLVNLRLEFLLVYGDDLVIKTWLFESFNPTVFFWMELSWLFFLAVESAIMFWVFSNQRYGHSRIGMQFAGAIGLILAVTCSVLLLVAEWLRPQEYGSFGSREKAGVGDIEPYTGLIALHFLRLPIGQKVASVFKFGVIDKTLQKHIPGHSIHGSSHHRGSAPCLASEVGTAIEIWQKAIATFPDVVEKYGEFSSELLQAMLGVPIISKDSIDKQQQSMANELCIASSKNSQIPIENYEHMIPVERGGNEIQARSLFNFSEFSSNISPEVQEVIFSGQIGHPVRFKGAVSQMKRTTSDESSYSTSQIPGAARDIIVKSTIKRSLSAPEAAFELDLRKEQEEREYDKQHNSILIEPNAPLIRSMRRCERKLPSILDHWALVDVVLTQYELVYFDATDFHASDVLNNEDIRRVVRDAIVATKGGKKLRLRDVALGRKIVGHIDLRKIDFVKLLRFPPGNNLDESPDRPSVDSEYWKDTLPKASDNLNTLTSNKRRWERVEEDVMKIHSSHGVLLLRFLADLDSQESVVLTKAKTCDHVALSWCQTIGRICGTGQLKQDLPHFGQQGEIELSDYIQLSSREQEHSTWSMFKHITSKAISIRTSVSQRETVCDCNNGLHGESKENCATTKKVLSDDVEHHDKRLSDTIEGSARNEELV